MYVCLAQGCDTEILPTHLMCAEHWRLVPVRLRVALHKAKPPGQHVNAAGETYRVVAAKVIDVVHRREVKRGRAPAA